MTTVVPIGYITILEAAEKLLPAMYAGVPDLPIVTSLAQKGHRRKGWGSNGPSHR